MTKKIKFALPKIHFQIPSFPLVIEDNTAHIWHVNLDEEFRKVNEWLSFLSKDEIAKSNRFVLPHHTKNYIISHGILRKIISAYLEMQNTPEKIIFTHNQHGKPSLGSECNSLNLHFNISHSGNRAIYALTKNHPIGIDIEHTQRETNKAEIANQFFSSSEIAEFNQVLPEEQTEAFYTLWTCKEAFMKALGKGFSLPLNQFEISILLSDKPQLLKIQNTEEETANWLLHAYKVDTDYITAIALHKSITQLQFFSF